MITITTVSQFVEIIKKKSVPSTIYRGVSNKDFNLLPSIGRELDGIISKGHDKQALLRLEKKMIRLFTTHSYQYHRRAGLPFLELLAIGQHHGLKTRLLDWTKSPMSALFFAAEKDLESDGLIYLYNTVTSNYVDGKTAAKIKTFTDIKQNHVFIPLHSTPRINAQQGLFQVFKDPTVPFTSDKVETVIIDSKSKLNILRELYFLGVNKHVLFPDLDGLSAFLNWEKFVL